MYYYIILNDIRRYVAIRSIFYCIRIWPRDTRIDSFPYNRSISSHFTHSRKINLSLVYRTFLSKCSLHLLLSLSYNLSLSLSFTLSVTTPLSLSLFLPFSLSLFLPFSLSLSPAFSRTYAHSFFFLSHTHSFTISLSLSLSIYRWAVVSLELCPPWNLQRSWPVLWLV